MRDTTDAGSAGPTRPTPVPDTSTRAAAPRRRLQRSGLRLELVRLDARWTSVAQADWASASVA